MIEQVPFGTNSFAENSERRAPCVLLLDISSSMAGEPIRQLNEGLVVFKDELAADSLAAKRVDTAIVTFGGHVQTLVEFTTAEQFVPPQLTPYADTPMGEAIRHAVDLVHERKQTYKANGIMYYRPWIFMITDGAPTDEWKSAADRVKEGESSKSFAFFAVGTEDANFEILRQISTRAPLKLKGLRFRDLFKWLSTSQKRVSQQGSVDAEVALTNPTGPDGWAQV